MPARAKSPFRAERKRNHAGSSSKKASKKAKKISTCSAEKQLAKRPHATAALKETMKVDHKIVKLVGERKEKDGIYYLVRWEGYSKRFDSWVHEIDVCQSDVDDLHASRRAEENCRNRDTGAQLNEAAAGLAPESTTPAVMLPRSSSKKKTAISKVDHNIDKLVDERKKEDGIYYLVRWEGYSKNFDSWVHEIDVCQADVDDLHASRQDEENPNGDTGAEAQDDEEMKEFVTPVETSKETVFHDVVALVDERKEEDGTYYKVRWVGNFKDTWEPEFCITDDLKTAYKAQKKQESKRTQKKQSKKKGLKADCALQLGSMPVNRMVFDAKLYKKTSLLGELLGKNRLCEYEADLKTSTELTWGGHHFVNGITYELAACRVSRTVNQIRYARSYKVTATMVAVRGPGLQPISLANKLNSLADFGSLTPEKAKSRLELLVSTTNRKAIRHWKQSDLEMIPEDNNLGCGFYPADNPALLYSSAKSKKQAVHQIVQVRILCPKLGLFKGVLCPKCGINKIQLPESMLKVAPTKHPKEGEQDDSVHVVVKNQFPSYKNKSLARQLNNKSTFKIAPYQTARRERQDPGDMHFRLWAALGVPLKKRRAYYNRCNNPSPGAKGVKHAYLVGVADPTGKLPANKIFVPGLADHIKSLEGKKLYITRSPCVEPGDGRLVGFVQDKPSKMSKQDWNFINSFPFGSVIFGPPRSDSKKAMPETIADGDLDGDLYFVMWDKDILESMKEWSPSVPEDDACVLQEKIGPTASSENSWLGRAQSVMVDLRHTNAINSFACVMWGAAIRQANQSPPRTFMKDPTAIQLARAFKVGLKMMKHGGTLAIGDVIRPFVKQSHSILEEPTQSLPHQQK